MDQVSQILPLVILVGLIWAVRRIGSRIGIDLQMAKPSSSVLLACAWGIVAIAAANWPFLNRRAWLLSMSDSLSGLGQVAALLLMFHSGLCVRSHGPRALPIRGVWISTATVGAGIVGGWWVAAVLGFAWEVGVFVAAVAVVPSLVALASPTEPGLSEKSDTPLPGIALRRWTAGIVIGCVIVVAALHRGVVPLSGQAAHLRTLLLLGKTALFFGLAWILGSRFAKRLAETTNSTLSTRFLIGFALMSAVIYGYAAEFLGQLVGLAWAYLAGALFGRTGYRSEVEKGASWLAHTFCLPLLFIAAGLNTEIVHVNGGVLLLFTLPVAIRALGEALIAKRERQDWRVSLRTGVSATPQGEMGVILATYGLAETLTARPEFSVLVIGTLVTTLIAIAFPQLSKGSATNPFLVGKTRSAEGSLG